MKERGCTTGLCVNPEHLEPVPHRENQRRMRLTVCRAGLHDLTDPDNVVWDSQGQRRGCGVCRRNRALVRYHKRKGRLDASV